MQTLKRDYNFSHGQAQGRSETKWEIKMTTTSKEIVSKIAAARLKLTDDLIAKISAAADIQALESVLVEDDATTLVYANATPADQQKIDAAVEARAAQLA